MALITQRICDNLANHEDGPAEGEENVYTVNGVTVKIDQCKACAEPYLEAFEDLRLIGRTVASERPRGASPKDELVSCPYCDRPAYPRIGYLFQHVRREHSERLDSWLESTGYVPRLTRRH